MLDGALTREDKMLDGETVFQLYDTFVFVVDPPRICRGAAWRGYGVSKR